jgi:putative transposase
VKQPIQLSFPSHGGARKGAGRHKTGRVSHDARPAFGRVLPAHITLRVAQGLPSLRSSRNFAAIRDAFAAARGRNGMRLIEFSVLGNHLHLVVEAESSASLSRGMQGLCIRVARALNRVLARVGRVFADHYHSHLLKTPAEVLSAIRYVLENAARHYGLLWVDPFSSAREGSDRRELLSEPRGWLLCSGWRRARRRSRRALAQQE